MRRAGLARFTTFACALGLALSAFTGPKPALALTGLMVALAGAMGGAAWAGPHPVARVRGSRAGGRPSCRARLGPPPRRGTPRSSARPGPRSSARIGSGLLVLSVLMVGLFAGYLAGDLRVAALTNSALKSRIGSDVTAELVITGQVRANAGWQNATAVVRRLTVPAPAGGAGPAGGSGDVPSADDPAVGETVLLDVAPDDNASGAATSGAAASGGTASSAQAEVTALTQGMIVAFKGTIEAPEGPSDSGYDQARQLLHQGIQVVFTADGPGSITVLGRRGGVSGWFDQLRASARVHLSQGPSARVNEVLQGVVMGDTVGIDEGWLVAFRRSGTAHMLSPSGLHVASIAAIILGLARLVRAPRWAGFLLAAMSALLMIPFVGASPPIIRSAVMIVIVLTGYWVGRSRDQWQVLGLAAVVVLALNPFAVFDVGFQLSFAAFVAMLLLIRPLQRLLRRLPSAIGSNVAVSLAASAGTAPVALAVFDKTSLVSPLANLLVVPTLPLVTGLGMASVFLGFIWAGLSVALDTLASLPMTWTIQVSRLTALAPVLNAADLGRALFALGTGVAALPAALALMGRSVRTPLNLPLPMFKRSIAWLRARRPRNRGWATALGAAVVLFGLVVGGMAYPSLAGGVERVETAAHARGWPSQVEVRVLDVGQGNAILVRTPERHALLFDGGPGGCGLAAQLHALGVRRLDLVVISHPHADHFAGLLEALDGLKVDALVDQVEVVSSSDRAAAAATQAAHTGSPASRAGPATSSAGATAYWDGENAGEAGAYLELRRKLTKEGCRYVLASTGSSVKVDAVSVRFFAPARPQVLVDGADPWAEQGGEPSGDELNGASLVAVVSVGSIDVLLPGDAEAGVLETYQLPPVDVIVVPHHGSRGGVSESLLKELAPRAAFISVGKDNPFGHPYPGTVSMLERAVGTVLRTDTAGWVCCTVNGNAMVITTERTPTR